MAINICSLKEVASWKRKDIGNVEENVKIKVVVPLLISLGHKITQLDFEHYGIDIFLKGLPSECQVIVETKSLEEDLETHLPQLRKYVERTNALFALISNGEQIRVYALPYDVPLFSIQREELTEPAKYELLQKFLSRKNLTTKKSLMYLYEDVLRIQKIQIQKYKDLIAVSNVVKKYVYGEHVDEKDRKLISRAKKMGLLPILDKMDEATAHGKNLGKLIDKLRKLVEKKEQNN